MGYGRIDTNIVNPTELRGEVSTTHTGYARKFDLDYGSYPRVNSEK